MSAVKDSISVSFGDVNIERIEKAGDRAADSYLVSIIRTRKIEFDMSGKELYDLARAALTVLQLADMLPTAFPRSPQ